MGWLRVAVAVSAMLHGGAHLMWFLGAWIPRTHAVGPEPWLFSPGVTITGAVGRLSGLLALAAAAGFVAAGIGVPTAAGLSVVVVVPWWPASFPPSLNATLANVGLVLVTAVPALREFAHLP
jgi:hypothetical protein